MGFIEGVDHEGLTDSLLDVYHKQSLFYRNIRECAHEDFGDAATPAIRAGLEDYGRWRAEVNRIQPSVVVDGQEPGSWVANWEAADFMMFATDPGFRSEGQAGEVRLSMPAPPEQAYFDQRGQGDWLQDFWDWTLAGLCEGMPGLDASASRTQPDRWEVVLRGAGVDPAAAGVASPLSVLDDAPRAIALIRQSSVYNGGLYFFLARALIAAFDASGEACVRRGVRGIGRERGQALRDRHLAEGKPLDMKTLMDGWDGPLVSVWQWRDEGTLDSTRWLQDCTWCPYASAWQQFGTEGLSLGYLYDIELHTTMYNTYLPGIQVRWDTLKTRGDSTCGFRITASPEVLAAGNWNDRPAG